MQIRKVDTEMTIGELKMELDKVEDEMMEVVFLDRGGFIVKVNDAYVSNEDKDDETQFVISH